MNILPHKSWHVRTQKNIARVKKDQAKAAEEEKEKQRRIALAAQEARTSFLRERAGQRLTGPNLPRDVDDDNEGSTETVEPKDENPIQSDAFALSADLTQSDGHINFFQEIEDGKRQESGVNADHEEEKKIEKEDYEKKIGLLVYLGQNSLEHSKDRPWYERVERSKVKDKDKEVPTTTDKDLKIMKLKDFQDPLKDIRSYLSSPGMKKKYGDLSGPKTRKIEFAAASTSVSTTTVATKRKATEEASEDIPKKKKKKFQKHKSKKHKHHKKHHKRSRSKSKSVSSDSEDEQEVKRKKLEKLRTERLEREREEKRKADKLLANLRGETYQEELPKSDQTNTSESSGYQPAPGRKQKYNSQFNPQLARQNFDNHYK